MFTFPHLGDAHLLRHSEINALSEVKPDRATSTSAITTDRGLDQVTITALD